MWNAYKHFITANGTLVESAESLLSSSLWLLPNRFQEPSHEASIEAVHSALGLLSLLHEHIRCEHAQRLRGVPSTSGLPWPLCLAAIRQIEVLVEIRATDLARQGRCNKYSVLMVLEAIKSAMKLVIKFGMRQRLLIDNGLTLDLTAASQQQQRASITAAFAQLRETFVHGVEHPAASLPTACSRSPAAGSSGAAHASSTATHKLWWERPPPQRIIRSHSGTVLVPPDLDCAPPWRSGKDPAVAERLLAVGEVLFAVRPLLYVALLRRYGPGKWTPWVLSLLLDVTSRVMVSGSGKVMETDGVEAMAVTRSPVHSTGKLGILDSLARFRWSPQEQGELTRRKLLLLAYLVRTPMYESVVRPAAGTLSSVTSYVPLLGWGVNNCLELLDGIQKYYTYTSGS